MFEYIFGLIYCRTVEAIIAMPSPQSPHRGFKPMSVQRYEPTDRGKGIVIEVYEAGRFVTWRDYAALEADHAKLERQLDVVSAGCRAHQKDADDFRQLAFAVESERQLQRRSHENAWAERDAAFRKMRDMEARLAAAEKVCQVADDCAENGYHMEPREMTEGEVEAVAKTLFTRCHGYSHLLEDVWTDSRVEQERYRDLARAAIGALMRVRGGM